MQDEALCTLIRTLLLTGLAARNLTTILVEQGNQPTQEGVNTAPTLYFSKNNDVRFGFLKREDKDDPLNPDMTHTETQRYETTFQVEALVIQTPSSTVTASDLVNIAADIMQSDATRRTLKANHLGILRIPSVTNPYFVDDRDQFEASPTFDFTITHKQATVSVSPAVSSIEPGIYPI